MTNIDVILICSPTHFLASCYLGHVLLGSERWVGLAQALPIIHESTQTTFCKIDTELYLTGERTGSHVSRLAVLLLWSVCMRPVLLQLQDEELDHDATALRDLPHVCPRRLDHHARPNRTAVACLSGT